jgi:hypothetical protein
MPVLHHLQSANIGIRTPAKCYRLANKISTRMTMLKATTLYRMIAFRFDLPVLPLKVLPQSIHLTWVSIRGPKTPPHQVKGILLDLSEPQLGQGAKFSLF